MTSAPRIIRVAMIAVLAAGAQGARAQALSDLPIVSPLEAAQDDSAEFDRLADEIRLDPTNYEKTYAFIRLATPTTDDARLPAVLANTSGFVYYVSITGVTGSATPDPAVVAEAVARIKRHTDLPVAVGFGVRDAASAAAIGSAADGVVVGSAIVEAVRTSLVDGKASGATVGAVGALVETLARAASAGAPAR